VAVAASLARDRLGVWSTLTTRRVPTNDTSRAIAWLWAAAIVGCDGGYLEATERDSFRTGMTALIARRAPGRVMWVELDLDDGRRKLPAVLVAHVRVDDDVKTIRMGRCGHRPPRSRWTPQESPSYAGV
jgi:hypothetical protein